MTVELTPEQLEEARKLLAKEFEDKNNSEEGTAESESEGSTTDEEALEAEIAKRLAPVKSKLDEAYKKVEAEKKRADELERQRKEDAKQKLLDSGKHDELKEMEVTELREKNEALMKQVTGMTRDRQLEDALTGLEFRNSFARNMAFNAIIPQLEQNSNGEWVHETGVSITEFVKIFAKDPEHQDTLFKPKTNSGTGTPSPSGKTTQGLKKKITEMTSQELFQAAEDGLL